MPFSCEMLRLARIAIAAGGASMLMPVLPSSAMAETIQIVAFGDSLTAGHGKTGVPQSQAYPAVLEGLLRARGWNVSVANAGVPGDRTTDGLARVGWAVPAGTRLTIVSFGGNDLLRDHASPAAISANLSRLAQIVRAKGSDVIVFAPLRLLPRGYPGASWGRPVHARPGKVLPQYDSGDGEHPNAAGHRVIAARALPDVERALRRIGLRPGH